MEPTLGLGSHVLVQALTDAPVVGEVVVFHPPVGAVREECGPIPHVIRLGGGACLRPVPEPSNEKFVKRIVAEQGDTISIVEGHLIRNGVRVSEPYIRRCGSSPECTFPTPIVIAAGHWFMLGDNRGESDDSRFWGPIPTAWIIGRARPCSVVGIACVEAELPPI
jgi:signal peptidase I